MQHEETGGKVNDSEGYVYWLDELNEELIAGLLLSDRAQSLIGKLA